jgi:7,8-dihydropterin-6-yl-methyl-4-(beta-D-ribofuranosyl)aminobenzene 5'-phosphate synthase
MGGEDRIMRLTLLIDDIVPEGVTPVDGFSILVEAPDALVLFDTGPDGEVLLAALDRVGVGVRDLDLVVISHSPKCHSGGLARLLFEHRRLPVSVPVSESSKISKMIPRDALVLGEDGPRKLAKHIMTTGDMGGEVPEQALILETDHGNVVLNGCAHPGIANMMTAAGGSTSMIIGGFHDLSADDLPYPEAGDIVVCHCTPRKRVLAHMFPQVTLWEVGSRLEFAEPLELNQSP